MMKAIQYGLGILLIMIGVAGLFLPVLQGVLLILLGVVVLRADSLKNAGANLKDYWKDLKKKSLKRHSK